MTFNIDLQEQFINNYESVAMIFETKFIIFFGIHNWAPGVWAGTEGFILNYKDNKFEICKIDFDQRLLECKRID